MPAQPAPGRQKKPRTGRGFMNLFGVNQARLRFIQPSNPKPEPNSQTAAGRGTTDQAVATTSNDGQLGHPTVHGDMTIGD